VLLTIPVAGVALGWAGRESFIALTTASVLGLVWFIASQTRVFSQRNGTFFVLALGLFASMAIPVGIKLVLSGSEFARSTAELVRVLKEKGGVASVQPTPTTPSLPSPLLPTAPERPAEPLAPAGERSKPAPPVEPSVTQAPAKAPASEEIPDEDPKEKATRLAKAEAYRRYPGLETTGSPEYIAFMNAYRELERFRKFEFFKDPQWPLKLAELVAKQEGWKRADAPEAPKPTAPLSASAPAMLPAPTSPQPKAPAKGNPPNAGSLLPGEEIALDGPNAAVPADPSARENNRALIEARRRYPALGNKDSMENQKFLEAYNDLLRRNPAFFENPEWPLRLADLIARREGWKPSKGEEPPLPR
jgi:hypothetical protein